MKAIIPDDAPLSGVHVNRQQMRNILKRVDKKSRNHVSKEQIEQYLLWDRLKRGGLTEADVVELSRKKMLHYDNIAKFPDGTEVKLNYDGIMRRPQDELTDDFKTWVNENKDKVFHLDREDNKESLVCLTEDERYREIDGKTERIPRWLFDLFSDLLVKNEDNEWVEPGLIEGSMDDYTEITDEVNQNK